MPSLRADDLESLKKTLRTRLREAKDDGGEVTLSMEQVRLLLDELSRLQQSSDRLRRQNRRARLRLQKAGLEAGAGAETGDDREPAVDGDEN